MNTIAKNTLVSIMCTPEEFNKTEDFIHEDDDPLQTLYNFVKLDKYMGSKKMISTYTQRAVDKTPDGHMVSKYSSTAQIASSIITGLLFGGVKKMDSDTTSTRMGCVIVAMVKHLRSTEDNEGYAGSILEELRRMKEDMKNEDSKKAKYEATDVRLNDALASIVLAENNAREIIDIANKKAEEIERIATENAESIIDKATMECSMIEAESEKTASEIINNATMEAKRIIGESRNHVPLPSELPEPCEESSNKRKRSRTQSLKKVFNEASVNCNLGGSSPVMIPASKSCRLAQVAIEVVSETSVKMFDGVRSGIDSIKKYNSSCIESMGGSNSKNIVSRQTIVDALCEESNKDILMYIVQDSVDGKPLRWKRRYLQNAVSGLSMNSGVFSLTYGNTISYDRVVIGEKEVPGFKLI